MYWFRTPPGVRVGRAALDDEAVRLLQQHNPDVQFDWPRLLKDSAAPEAPRRERDGRDRDGRERDRRERRESRPAPRPQRLETSAAAAPPLPTPEAAEEIQALLEAADERAAEHAEVVAQASEASGSAGAAPGFSEPEPEPRREPEDLPPTAASARLGVEGVKRLRSRYADLIGRLADKEMDDAARAELNAQAARLNPDAWSTPDDVTAALEQYESIFEALRSVVGRHPRSRRPPPAV